MKEATHKITIFSNYKKTLILNKEITVEEVIKRIKKQHHGLYISAAREAGKGTKEYETIKALVPSFTPHGTFKGGKNNDLVQLSGFVYLDIDGQEIDLDTIISIPSLFACWKSISGTGYSLLFKAEGYTAKQINHVIKAIAGEHGIPYDNNAKALNRAVVISADPELYHNPDATPFQFNGTMKEEDTVTPIFSDAPLQVQNNDGETKPKKSKTDNNFIFAQDLPQYAPKYYDFSGGDIYHIYDEPAYQVELHKNRIPVGKRHDSLRIIAGKVIALYQKFPEAEVYERFKRFNLVCQEPLETDELNRIFRRAVAEFKEGVLAVATQKRQGKINPNLPDDLKKKAPGMMGGEIRRRRARAEIKEAILTLQAEGKKIRQKDVVEKTGKSIRKVKTYWEYFKDEVTNYNKGIKTPTQKVSTELKKAA